MIINSGHPIEVHEFPEGWEHNLLIGFHELKIVVPESGREPEVAMTTLEDKNTLDIARMIVAHSDVDYRLLGYTHDSSPTNHYLQFRVGDFSANPLMRNAFFGGSIFRSKTKHKAKDIPVGDSTSRPFRFRGRGIFHLDGEPTDEDRDSVLYTLTNQEGTLHYQQRFWRPRTKGVLVGCLYGPLLHLQARPGAATRARDNVLNRTYTNRDIHASDRHQPWIEKQRVFVKDYVTAEDN